MTIRKIQGQTIDADTLDGVELAGLATVPDATAGNYLETSADTERAEGGATYNKLKEIVLGRAGTYRVKFDLKHSTAAHTAWGAIYKNGALVGTPQSEAGSTYVTKSEDIAGLAAGDLLQLYLKVDVEDGLCNAKNLRIYSGNPLVSLVLTD